MSVLFVILIQLIVVFLISVIFAIIFSIISYFTKINKKRKIIFSILSPFIFCFSLYFLALIGSGVVSRIKKIDIGIGDYWYVLLTENTKLSFIDLPENSYVEYNEKEQFTDVQKVAQIGNDFYLKTSNDKIYLLTEKANKISETKITKEPKFLTSWDFYIQKRNEKVGNLLIFVGIISLGISIILVYLLRKILML